MTFPFPAHRAAGQIVEAAETESRLDFEPIVNLLGGSYALMFRMRVADNRVEDAASHGVDVGYVNRLHEAGRERMLPGWLSQLDSGSVIDRSLFGSDRQFARTPFYNHVIRPEGSFHCMIATLLNSRSSRWHLVIGRPHHRPSFGADDMRLFRCMLPLVNEVVVAKADLAHREAMMRSAFGICEAWQSPVLVATAQGVVQYANRWARLLLATRDVLVTDASLRLRSNTRCNDQKLQQAIAAAWRTGQQQSISLQTAKRTRDFRLLIRKADATLAGGSEHAPRWMVITVEDEQEQGSDDACLAMMKGQYGLTGREAELLSGIAQGLDLREACRQLGISYNTGRCHLRQIFGKTEVHRQSDLVRLYANFRTPSRQ